MRELSHDFDAGTMHMGNFDGLSATLREAGVDDVHISNLDTILSGVKSGAIEIQPLMDFLKLTANETFRKTLLVCVASQDCRLPAHRNTTAFYLNGPDRTARLSLTAFEDMSEMGVDEWIELDRRAVKGTEEFRAHGSPNAVIVQPFRARTDAGDGLDPLLVINTFEGELLHEIVHAADTELIRIWVDANLIALQQKREPDRLFKLFTKISPVTGRVYVSTEFWTIFSEARAYQTSLEVWKLFNPNAPNLTRLTHQVFFGAWMYTVRSRSNHFNAPKLAGLPTEDAFRQMLTGGPTAIADLMIEAGAAMQATLEGPESWRAIMVRTINEAQHAVRE